MRPYFTWLYWSFFSLVFVVIAAVAWIVVTEQGSAWAIQQALQGREPQIQMRNIRGRLLDGVTADSLSWAQAGTRLNIENVELRYLLIGILSGQLIISQLVADKITLQLPEDDRDRKKDRPSVPEFTSPWVIQLKNLQVGLLEIQRQGKPAIQIKNLSSSGRFKAGKVSLKNSQAQYQSWLFEGNSAVELRDPFPLDAQLNIRSEKDASTLALVVKGHLSQYQLHADARFRQPGLPEASGKLKGKGSLTGLKVESLTVRTLDGVIQAQGTLDWNKTFGMALDVSATGMNPAVIRPDYPGSIDLEGQVMVQGKNLESRFKAHGTLGDFPLAAAADIEITKSLLDIRQGRFSVGPNHLNVSGKVSPEDAEKLSYEIDAQDLSLLHPDLKGSLKGKGIMQGAWAEPLLELSLTGKNLAFQSRQLKRMNIELLPSAILGEYQLAVDARGIQSGATLIKQLEIKGQGSVDRQRLSYRLVGGPQGLVSSAALEGHYNHATREWQGTLDRFQLSAKELPTYKQRNKASLVLSANRQSVADFCLQHSMEKLCLTAAIDRSNDSAVEIKLSSLPLRRLKPWFPQAATFKDHLEIKMTAKGSNGHWLSDIHAGLDSSNKLAAQVEYRLSGHTLSGKLTADFNKLQWLNLLTDQIAAPAGKITAALDLSGTLDQPRLLGDLRLDHGSMRIPVAGAEIKNAALTITLQPGQQAKIKGTLTSGGGVLSINGKAQWPQLPDWMVNIDLVGENIEATHLPLAHVMISPALKFHATQERVFIGGAVKVPEAEIDLGDIPVNAIHTSPDTVIVGLDNVTEKRVRLPLDIAIALLLGDQVHLQGLGLDTRLKGRLQLEQKAGRSIKADGVLGVAEGSFKAFGQDLKIERGDIFFNGPITDPRLSVRAIREVDVAGVIAGLELTGTIDEPESRVFSIPPLPESEALSYLLTGKPLMSAGEGDSNFLLSAAVSLGLKQSKGTLDSIRRKAGLDTFAIQAGQDVSQTTLVAGKYLTPKLYVEYATRLFEDSSVYSMRFKLSEKLQLEAESGDNNQAMDLILQFERN